MWITCIKHPNYSSSFQYHRSKKTVQECLIQIHSCIIHVGDAPKHMSPLFVDTQVFPSPLYLLSSNTRATPSFYLTRIWKRFMYCMPSSATAFGICALLLHSSGPPCPILSSSFSSFILESRLALL